MIVLEILVWAVVGVWIGVGLWSLYQLGYGAGERDGRRQGCRCRRGEGKCPCQQKEGQ